MLFLKLPLSIGASFLASHSIRIADSFNHLSVAALRSFSLRFLNFLVTSSAHLISMLKVILLR
jgi:hypothetical protein